MKSKSAKTAQTAAEEPAAPVPGSELTLEEHMERERQAKIAEYAYFLAMARGFTPGRELDDWVEAERALEKGADAPAG